MAQAQMYGLIIALEKSVIDGNVEEATKSIDEILRLSRGENGDAADGGAGAANAEPTKVRVAVKLENWKITDKTVIQVHMPPSATIGDLRANLHENYQIHREWQTIFREDQVLEDWQKLADVGVKEDSDMVIVYVRKVPPTEVANGGRAATAAAQAVNGNQVRAPEQRRPNVVPLNPLEAFPVVEPRVQPVAPKPQPVAPKPQPVAPKPQPAVVPPPPAPPMEPQGEVGWVCPLCTFVNLPYRPGCEICSNDRPDDYVVPQNYKPTNVELKWCNGR